MQAFDRVAIKTLPERLPVLAVTLGATFQIISVGGQTFREIRVGQNPGQHCAKFARGVRSRADRVHAASNAIQRPQEDSRRPAAVSQFTSIKCIVSNYHRGLR